MFALANHNEHGHRYRTQRMRPGRGASLRATLLGGQTIEAHQRSNWRHPWQVTPRWLGGSGHWVITIKPGFVNHACPIWRTTITAEMADGRDYGTNPLTGEAFFSASVFGQATTSSGRSETVDIPLYLDPAIPMSWRALGFDSAGTEGIPPFFLDRGVEASPLADLIANPLGFDKLDVNKLEGSETLRLLRVCDVWLHQPRAALTSSVSVEPGVVTGIFTLKQILGEKPSAPGDVLQVMVGEYDELEEPSIDAVADNYEEFPWDELLLARVYLLSPAGVKPGSEPDGTWTPYVGHNVFWNLLYHATPFVPPVPEPNAPFIVTLAGGLAQPIINYLTSSLNDGLLRVFNVTRGQSLAGQFWTATGGSMQGTATAAAASAGGLKSGMDKAGQLRAELRAEGAKVRATTLDPGFPYRGLAFDPVHFITRK